jgi:hypothetical protein
MMMTEFLNPSAAVFKLFSLASAADATFSLPQIVIIFFHFIRRRSRELLPSTS